MLNLPTLLNKVSRHYIIILFLKYTPTISTTSEKMPELTNNQISKKNEIKNMAANIQESLTSSIGETVTLKYFLHSHSWGKRKICTSYYLAISLPGLISKEHMYKRV